MTTMTTTRTLERIQRKKRCLSLDKSILVTLGLVWLQCENIWICMNASQYFHGHSSLNKIKQELETICYFVEMLNIVVS